MRKSIEVCVCGITKSLYMCVVPVMYLFEYVNKRKLLLFLSQDACPQGELCCKNTSSPPPKQVHCHCLKSLHHLSFTCIGSLR